MREWLKRFHDECNKRTPCVFCGTRQYEKCLAKANKTMREAVRDA
jgi:hypothetical protein